MVFKLSRENAIARNRLDDRQVTELIGIVRGFLADNILSDDEILYLRKWLAASEAVVKNPLIVSLYKRINEVLADGIIDDEEREDLFATLTALTGNNFEEGELLKSSTLPLCSPAPTIIFSDNRFTFTGTFFSGKRKDCERMVQEYGGLVGGLSQKTRYLVIGEYATETWMYSSFGRKIERAVELREAGFPIAIISEAHWLEAVDEERDFA